MSVVTNARAIWRARLALVAALTASSMVVAACAGWPDGGGSGPSGPTRSPVTLDPGLPPPGAAGGAGARAGLGAGRASPSTAVPGSMTWVCAEVAQRYAALVVGPLGLGDDGPAAPAPSSPATDPTPIPAGVAHDLEELAQAYGAAARAIDDTAAGDPRSLDQAVTSVTAPAVAGAAHDVVAFLRTNCP